MTMLNTNRRTRIRLLPTAMLSLALGAGFASVGHAQDISPLGAGAMDTALRMTAGELREEIRSTAHRAVWLTRVNVARDLGVRLSSQQRPFRLAGRDTGQRG